MYLKDTGFFWIKNQLREVYRNYSALVMMKQDHAQKKFKIDLSRKGKVTRNVTLEGLCG